MNCNKRFLAILFFFLCVKINAQDFTTSWDDHFSYLNIKDAAENNGKIYAASENAIFIFDVQTNDFKTITTVNGLSGEIISSIFYSELYNYILIGFENGLIQIITDPNEENITNENITTVINILEKQTIPPNEKQINHFNALNDIVYISTGFGISIYNLENLEFGDTYFIGNGGAQIDVRQTAVFNDFIYVSSNSGIRRADINSSNLINFDEWQIVNGGNWIGIETFDNKLYALRTNNTLYEVVNTSITPVISYSDPVVELASENGILLLTTQKECIAYGSALNQITSLNTSTELQTNFTCATINANNDLFTGTEGIISLGKEGLGLIKTPINDPLNTQELHPEGPLLNRIFSVETSEDNLWVVHGGYSTSFGIDGALRRSGISHHKNDKWINIKYDTIKARFPGPDFLSHITINPSNSNNVFISSYFSGLIELENDELIERYDQDNSTIEAFANAFELMLPGIYDNNGALWVLNGRVNNALQKFENGSWQSFEFMSLINNPTSNTGFSSIVQDNEGNFYIGSRAFGLIGFNENGGSPIIKNVASEEQNLPSINVYSLAIDRRNQLWIGTRRGLRVLGNPSSLLEEDDVVLNSIIILEDGLAQELLFQQFITDIEVDGSNNKWIATSDIGVFYVSEDGQETIFHFTKDNSPLPSNNVTDITIDESNGRVYFATFNGLVSFESGSSKPVETIESAFVFPNPVRPGFNFVDEKIKIKDISDNVNIKITDIEGNLVAEAESNTNLRNRGYNLEIDGGTAFWNGKNLSGRKVSSGVYLIMLTDLDSIETKVLKLMVVR